MDHGSRTTERRYWSLFAVMFKCLFWGGGRYKELGYYIRPHPRYACDFNYRLLPLDRLEIRTAKDVTDEETGQIMKI